MKRIILLNLVVVSLLYPAELKAASTTPAQAEKVVRGWLKADAQPLGTTLGGQIANVETFSDGNHQPIYYVVYLQPSGFVIVPADDLAEPIIAFVEQGTYDPSPDNPLGALVGRDLPGRIAAARDLQATAGAQTQKKDGTERREAFEKAGLEAQSKWAELQDYADMVQAMGLSDISEVWVAPLLESKWCQTMAWGEYCYNYYTPNHYVCGCLATAMAQVTRYYEHPSEGIGVHTFTITVDGNPQDANTRGGDGNGGPYNWSDMPPQPEPNITLTQRQAIGALCYDAGVSAHMDYTSSASGAGLGDAMAALKNVFGYSNAVYGGGIPWGVWNNRVNPSLDAACPVLLAIRGAGLGHAVVCDGYGYDLDTLYHHINMGWGGMYDAWYNLPNIGSYFSIGSYVHNIFTSGSGEIISGRVMDQAGNPMTGLTVSADTGSQIYDANTNDKGIYALAKVPANTTFTVSASKNGYTFVPQSVTTGYSDYYNTGSKWGIDFEGVSGAHPVIWLSAEELEFTAVEGGANPEPQILSVWNCGFETLNWVLTDDCNWLQVEPNSGSSTGQPNEVTLSVDTTSLIHGSHDCELTISDPYALNSPQTVHVILYVTNELYVPGQYPTIQAAIDAAAHGCTIIVALGIYTGPGNCDLDYQGKRITVRSTHPNDPTALGATIIDCNGTEAEQHRGFYFHSNEDANSALDGFTIIKGYASNGGAINCVGSDPTIMNCIIIGNSAEGSGGLMFNGSGGGICNVDSNPTIKNCTISGNQAENRGGGIFNLDSSPTISNCILWNNTPEEICVFYGTPAVTYCNVQGGFSGAGNIDTDPCFADPNNGDYHLKSQAGRWDQSQNDWVTDMSTSDCIDAGDPNSDWTGELWPHGKRINMGAYGGTPQASMSSSDAGNVADLNNNDLVDYADLKLFTDEWLRQEVLLPEDLDRNGFVNFIDFAIFGENW